MKTTTFDQLHALWMLVWKFLRSNLEKLNGMSVQEAITRKDHPFWVKVGEAIDTLKLSIIGKMIADGHYHQAAIRLKEDDFSLPKKIIFGSNPKVFDFGKNVSAEHAIQMMDQEGYRPATFWDLLDFGAKNPEEQKRCSIAALGSLNECDGVPYLSYFDCMRGVDVQGINDLKPWDWVFLGVRK